MLHCFGYHETRTDPLLRAPRSARRVRFGGMGEERRRDRGPAGPLPVLAAGLGASALRAKASHISRRCSNHAGTNLDPGLSTLPSVGCAGTDFFQSVHEGKRVRVRPRPTGGKPLGGAARFKTTTRLARCPRVPSESLLRQQPRPCFAFVVGGQYVRAPIDGDILSQLAVSLFLRDRGDLQMGN